MSIRTFPKSAGASLSFRRIRLCKNTPVVIPAKAEIQLNTRPEGTHYKEEFVRPKATLE